MLKAERERIGGRLMGQITCENLTFRYPGRAENALDGIQLQIGAGE